MDSSEHAQHIYTALIQAWAQTHTAPPTLSDLESFVLSAAIAARRFEMKFGEAYART